LWAGIFLYRAFAAHRAVFAYKEFAMKNKHGFFHAKGQSLLAGFAAVLITAVFSFSLAGCGGKSPKAYEKSYRKGV
jgi:hypothetical protein